MDDARATASSSPSISSESLSRRVRTFSPSSIKRIFSSRVPNNDSMPRLICTLDFIRGIWFLAQTEGKEPGRTSAGAEAGKTSVFIITESKETPEGRKGFSVYSVDMPVWLQCLFDCLRT